jgi:hypothetical protein
MSPINGKTIVGTPFAELAGEASAAAAQKAATMRREAPRAVVRWLSMGSGSRLERAHRTRRACRATSAVTAPPLLRAALESSA